MPYSNLALDADRENGPAARSSPPMRMTASWSGSNDPTAYKSVARNQPNGELPSDPQHRQAPTRARSHAKARLAVHHRSACSGVKALRNTSHARRQAAKLCYRFGPLTPSARSANLIAGDGTKNGLSHSEQKTLSTTQNNRLTGKAPYRFESGSLVGCGVAAKVSRRRGGPLLGLPTSVTLRAARGACQARPVAVGQPSRKSAAPGDASRAFGGRLIRPGFARAAGAACDDFSVEFADRPADARTSV